MLAFLRIEKESLKLGFGKNWRESGGNGGRGEMGSPLFIEVAANYVDQSMGSHHSLGTSDGAKL